MYQATVLFPADVDTTVGDRNPAEFPLRFLAEGDSWFSFGSLKFNSLLNVMKFKVPAAIVTLANPGATITRMTDIARNPDLDNWLSAPWGAFSWNAILVSGGGNDIMDRASCIVPPSAMDQPVKPPDQYVDRAALGAVLDDIEKSFDRIIQLRDRPTSPCVGVPLITHAYDWTTPRNAPAQFLVTLGGPWLYPAMRDARIPPSEWNAVSDFILAELDTRLDMIQGSRPNFHVARTQGTLRRAAPGTTGPSNDWDNEIHPRRSGYAKLAAVMRPLVEALTL